MATREQERAKFALEQVRFAKDLPQHKDFKTQLVKLPTRLHSNGLGQTIGFYLAAGAGSAERKICDWFGEWLKSPGKPYAENVFANRELIQCITGEGLPANHGVDLEAKYRQAAQEARALAVWLKRFAEAFIAGEGSS